MLRRLVPLVGVNAVPLGGVFLAGWSPATALTLYWWENLIGAPAPPDPDRRLLIRHRPGRFDPRMPLAAGAALACAVLVACYFPARRAARIDPAPLLHDA